MHIYDGDGTAVSDHDFVESYNLMDSSQLQETPINGYLYFKSDYYIPVDAGRILLCNRYKARFQFYNTDKELVSEEGYTNMFTPVTIPANTAYIRMYYNASFTVYGDNVLIYYSTNQISPTDDRRQFVPHLVMNGGVVNSTIYESTVPPTDDSEFMNRIKYNVMREIRKAENVIRIGCFNIYITRQFMHWNVLKKELQDHALDICGFEEVRYGSEVGVVDRRLPELLKSWQFPYGSYHNPLVQPSSNKALSSHWEVLSTQETVYPSNADGSFIKCVIKLPYYMDSRDGVNDGPIDLTLSVYVYHATSSKGVAVRLTEIADILNVIQNDTSDFKVVVGDANAFEAGVVDGHTQEWDAWIAGGFTPVYNSRNVNTVNSPRDIDPFDNIFYGANITCKGFNVIPSSLYKVTYNESTFDISDHDLLYADLVFDFDTVINAKIAEAQGE